MKIKKIYFHNMRNDEHFQFHMDVKELIANRLMSETGLPSELWSEYLIRFDEEDVALKKINKSAVTAEIQNADRERDRIFRGMVDANKSALNHFRTEVQESAKRLKIVFDTYGNLAQKPLNEETAGVYNLVQDLQSKYLADVQLTGISDWLNELRVKNEVVSRLMKERYEETAERSDLVLKEVRQKVDAAYRAIAERINALIVIEGVANYEAFVRNLNAIIEKYENIIAQRYGRKTVDD